jgi:DNA-binding NarL/FixJ family response regulator
MNDQISVAKHPHKTRIYLADDHEIFRTGLKTVLRFAGDVEITGESGIVPDLMPLIETSEPDIILLGTGAGTWRLIEAIKNSFPMLKILVLGDFEKDITSKSAFNLSGYINKESAPDFLRSAIKTIALGGTVWSPELLKLFVESSDNSCRVAALSTTGVSLSPRETRLLGFLAAGKTNKEISLELNIAQITVKKALQTLFGKLGATNRTQTVMKASQLGLI